MPPQRLIHLSLTVICATGLVSGCAGTKSPKTKPATPPKTAKAAKVEAPITAPAGAVGKVAMVNSTSRFVVLSYPINSVPAADQRLNVYRANMKVGVLKVTGPGNESKTVANIISGEIQVGDEVRED